MAASLLLSACGGGDGGDNTPPARNTGSISGNVFDAPVNGAKIDVFEYKDGKVGRKPRIQVRSATLPHLSSHAHFFEYHGWLFKA